MKRIIFLLIAFLALISCTKSPTTYFHPDVNLSYIKKVAVLPFENNSEDRNAAGIARDVFVTELLSSGLFDVVSYGETLRALMEKEVTLEEGIGTGEAKRLGKRLGVQGFIIGTVNEYGMVGRGLPYPQVSISARMIELPSGVLVWRSSSTAKGVTPLYRLFGVGGKGLVEVVEDVSHTIIDTLK